MGAFYSGPISVRHARNRVGIVAFMYVGSVTTREFNDVVVVVAAASATGRQRFQTLFTRVFVRLRPHGKRIFGQNIYIGLDKNRYGKDPKSVKTSFSTELIVAI